MSRGSRGKKYGSKQLGPKEGAADEGGENYKEKTSSEEPAPPVVAALVAKQSDSGKSSEQPAQPQDAPKHHAKFWLWNPDPIVRLTGWIATYTFFLLAVGLLQAWAYIQRERASLSTEITLSTGTFIPDTEIYFIIKIANTGGVAAFPISSFVGSRTGLPPAPEKYIVGKEGWANLIVPSGKEITQRYWPKIFGENIILNQAEADSINNGTVRLFVYGQIRYVDSFTFWPFPPSVTQFCYEYVPAAGGRQATFVVCSGAAS